MRYRFKHVVEYVLLRIVSSFFSLLPYRLALVLAWGLARVAYHGVRWRVREAQRRIRDVFPDMPCRKVRQTAWLSMRTLFFNAVDVMRTPRMTRNWVERHVVFRGWEHLEAARAGGRGGILALPHMGSWDAVGVATHLAGVPMFFIVGTQRNPLFDSFMNRKRGVTGITSIPRSHPAILRAVLRMIKQGSFLGILPDLRSRTRGLAIDFLGRQANLNVGFALFARQAGAPILPALITRLGWTRHEMVIHPPVTADGSLSRVEDLHRMTRTVMDLFTKAVREHPGQYFWYNKRWVLDPFPDSQGESHLREPA